MISTSFISLFNRFRDYLFPKIPLVSLTQDGDGGVVCFGGGRKHWVLRSDPEAYTVLYKYFVQHPNTRGGRYSATTPPPHYHLAQKEILVVRSGVLGYMLDGVERYCRAGETVVLEPFHNHSFWADGSDGEDLLFELTSSPGDGAGLDGGLLDNFDGYLTSALAAGKRPDFLQVMVFAYDAGTVIAFKQPWDRWLTAICGGIIGPLAGYKTRYPEFDIKKA